MILVIGNLSTWEREGRPAPTLEGFRFTHFEGLDLGLLAEVRPDMVLSTLVGDGFDAIDVARRLRELGYRGRYRALAHALPNEEAVRAEIEEAAPELDFDLVVLRSGRSGG